MSNKVRVGMIGSGFVADIHVHAFQHFVPDAEIVAVASPHNAAQFARARGIPNAFTDYNEMLQMKDLDVVSIGIPNYLHHPATLAAARAGKHIIIEKPLCKTLEEADEMIAVCKRQGVLLLYAEELLFAPKYVRARQLIADGAIGDPVVVKQAEEHDGPHMPWFWDVNLSGGGVLLDMGCHSVEFGRWMLGKRPVKSVQAWMDTLVHTGRTKGEDHSLCIVEYEGGAVNIAEDSWIKGGGVDDRCEILGTKGNTRADLLKGSSLWTFSSEGYGYAVEKAGTTKGWTFTMFEEVWNYGFPQEMQHFINCVLGKEEPVETGEDGREVLKILYAAYQSAGEGRKITFPYTPPVVDKPIDLWRRG